MIRKTLIGCLVLGLSTGCGREEVSSPKSQSQPDSQRLSSKTAIAGDSSAAPGHALTEAEVQERYSAEDPDSSYFYPGRKHPVNYSTWTLQRPEGELEHRLSDRFSNFELTTQHGKKVRFYDDLIRDHIVVISFVYTKCNGI